MAGPLDVVPRGDLAYDLLGSLAVSGRLPGYSLADFLGGNRLYTRAEVAALVHAAEKPGSTAISAHDRTALRALASEFAPELAGSGLLPARSSTPLVTGGAKLRALTGPDALDVVGRAAVAAPVGGSGFAALSLGNWRDEWYDPHAPLHGYPLVETAFVRENGRFLDVQVGEAPVRWGPGYVGGMLLSDQGPSIPQIRVEKTFLPGGWFRHLGYLHFEQFDGQFFETNIPGADSDATGSRRYLLGRRLEIAGPGRFSLSLGEAMKAARQPDPLWANLLPYYLYQSNWTSSSRSHPLGFLVTESEPDTYWKNYVADINAAYRTGAATSPAVYADLLINDLKAPHGLGFNAPTPQKLGEQIGITDPDLLPGGRLGARIEYASIDPGTYTNTSTPLVWQDQGVPLGYPSGPDTDEIFGRLDVKITDRIRLAAEAAHVGRRGTPFPALPPPGPTDNRAGLYATYALRRNLFLGARYEHDSAGVLGEPDHDRVEVNVGAGF
jgi:hypothetical protein